MLHTHIDINNKYLQIFASIKCSYINSTLQCVRVCVEKKKMLVIEIKKTGWNNIATLFVCVGHSYVLRSEQSEERETNINQADWPKCSHT